MTIRSDTAVSKSNRFETLIAPLALAAIAIFTRSRSLPRVVVDGVALALDTDAHYHLHRAQWTLRDFPHVPAFDPLLAWPEGCAATWPPGFDQLLAVFPWLLGLRGDPAAAARVMVLVPIVIGVALVLVTRDIARHLAAGRSDADAVGWCAGALCAVLPQAVAITEAGRTDHHGAEALIAALTLRWLIAWHPSLAHAPARRGEVAGALLFFVGVHVYCGSVLFAAVALGLVAIARLLRRDASPSLAGGGVAAAFGSAALLVTLDGPWIAAHRDWFHPLQLSLLQPALLALVGAVSLGVSLAARREHPAARLRTLGLAAMAIVAITVVALVAAPSARQAFVSGLIGWLGHRDPWMDSIAEVRPLFDRLPTTAHDWRRALAIGGTVAVALPIALPLAVAHLRSGSAPRRAFFAAYSLALLVCTLLQTRFGRPLVSILATSAALALACLVEQAARRLRAPGAALLPVALTALWIVADPALRAAFATPPIDLPSPIHEVALYLRAHPTHAVPGRAAGVFASWDRSHEILDVAGRPVTLTSFGPYVTPALFADGERAWRGDAEGLAAFMERADAGHVVTGVRYYLKMRDGRGGLPILNGPTGGRAPNPAFLRAQPAATLWIGGGGIPDEGVAHARHFMPVFASHEAVPAVAPAVPMLWLYERVRGARVVGLAPTGTRVTATITLAVRGVPRPWIAWTVAENDHYSLLLPLPTGLRTESIRTGERYALRIGAADARPLTVPMETVRLGAQIEPAP